MNLIKNYINKNIIIIAIAGVLFLAGIVIGSVVAVNLGPADANELREFLSPMVAGGALDSVTFRDIVANGCVGHLRLVAAMALCCLNIWLVPAAAVLVAARGYQLGFSVSFICGNFGFRGIVVSLLSAFSSYAVAVPVYALLFCTVMRHTLMHSRSGNAHRHNAPVWYIFIFAYMVLCVGSCIEGLLLPVFIDLCY